MKTLSQIGEFGLIERIRSKVKTDHTVLHGIGDDTAVLAYSKNKYLLFTTDMLIEGVHFSRRQASFSQIGRKSLAVNISDIAAMGGVPKYAVISAGLPIGLSLRSIDEMMQGINVLAKEFGINVVGGDTSRAEKIMLSVSLLGEADKNRLTLRSGAKPGDLLFVTGCLGGSRRLKQFNFIPQVLQAQKIIKQFRPTAMIDISDGLVCDLQRIAEQSKVGAAIFEQLIPVSPRCSVEQALYDGEDFELLFTVSLDSARKFYHQKSNFPISCIGKITEKRKGLILLDRKAKVHRLRQKGFKHFK